MPQLLNSDILKLMQNPPQDPQVIEAEVVDEPTGKDQALLVRRLEEMVKNHITSIDKIKKELGEQRDMLKASFENDPTYMEHDQEAKGAAKVKAKTKAEILKRPEVAQISEKVKSASQELRELNSALSDYLSEFQRVSGLNQIEGEDGEIREIVFVAKLAPKVQKH